MTNNVKVLLKEHPWLHSLHPLVPEVSSVRVERLDMGMFRSLMAGRIRECEYPSDRFGFLVTQAGDVVTTIHHSELAKPPFLRRISEWLNLGGYSRTLEEATAAISQSDRLRVRFVILVHQYVYNKPFVELNFYKMPQHNRIERTVSIHERTLDSLFRQSKELREEDRLRDEEEFLNRISEN